MSQGRVLVVGDACVAIEFGTTIDDEVNAQCVAFAKALGDLALAGVRDIVPTYNAVTVHFEPRMMNRDSLCIEMKALVVRAAGEWSTAARTVEVPVSYGGEAGPDLAAVASFAKCPEDEVIRLHTAAEYRVYMLGFLPGFPYMGVVDRKIAMARLDSPRLRVPEGSVGIAGIQTGIYPCESPGGWRIIGRTSLKLFDAARHEPSLFKAGDRVKFVAA